MARSSFDLKREIEKYATALTSDIFSPKKRAEIKREYSDHIEDAVYRYKLSGMSERDAFKRAREDIGEMAKVKCLLAEVHNNKVQIFIIDNVLKNKLDIKDNKILEDVERTLLSLLEPEIKEVELGKAEIRQVFTIGKTNKIAGCYVLEGKIVRSKDAALVRNGEVIFRGAIDQLKRFKDDVKEVAQGFECGISFAKWNDIQEGDIIEVSTTEEVERKSL